MSEKIELISFKTCPFVQRVAIVLYEKNLAFDTTYIDLNNKPQWFLEISPFGKVPVLRIKKDMLFESAIINEYLDEVYPPSLQPMDFLQRAHNRAWIEFSSGLIMSIVNISRAENKENFENYKQECQRNFYNLKIICNTNHFLMANNFL